MELCKSFLVFGVIGLVITKSSSQSCGQIPTVPTNLSSAEIGVARLNISWSSSCFIRNEVYFRLRVMNLNSSSATPTVIPEIEDLHYRVEIQDKTSCDVYSFQVRAVNGSVDSALSATITSSFPSLPDISSVESSLRRSLAKNADEVVLSFTFNDAMSCPSYSMLDYFAVLDNGMASRISKPINSVMSRSVSLTPNSNYSFKIIVNNSVGDTATNISQVFTTEVQTVSVNSVEDDTYSIRCTYLVNSDTRGCKYVLVSGVDGLENVTGVVDRNSTATIEVSDIGCYGEVLAYGYGEDGATDTLPIRTRILLEVCTFRPPQEDSFLLAYSILIVHVFAAVAIAVFIIGLLVYLRHNGYMVGFFSRRLSYIVERRRSSKRSRHEREEEPEAMDIENRSQSHFSAAGGSEYACALEETETEIPSVAASVPSPPPVTPEAEPEVSS